MTKPLFTLFRAAVLSEGENAGLPANCKKLRDEQTVVGGNCPPRLMRPMHHPRVGP